MSLSIMDSVLWCKPFAGLEGVVFDWSCSTATAGSFFVFAADFPWQQPMVLFEWVCADVCDGPDVTVRGVWQE